MMSIFFFFFFFFQAEDGIRDYKVTGVQTCALPISMLDREDPRRQAHLVVSRVSWYDGLRDDRSCVDLRAHEMHGTAAEPNTCCERPPVWVKTWKRRQQRRMNIDHLVAPCLD